MRIPDFSQQKTLISLKPRVFAKFIRWFKSHKEKVASNSDMHLRIGFFRALLC